MECSGTENILAECDAVHIAPEEGKELYKVVDVVGVSCKTYDASSTQPMSTAGASILGEASGSMVALILVCVFLGLGIIVIIRYCWRQD